MSFPIVNAASTVGEETCHLATDTIKGLRYGGLMFKDGMQAAYRAQQAESNNEQNAVDQTNWTDAQKAKFDIDL
jgi:hypothetical protein